MRSAPTNGADQKQDVEWFTFATPNKNLAQLERQREGDVFDFAGLLGN